MSSATRLAVIDDGDQSIHYSSPNWFDGKGDRLFGGTCKFSKVAGEFGTLSFSGTSITVYGTIFTIANSTMTFKLDNNPEESYNTTANSKPAFLHHQVLWQSPGLNDTEHTLVFTQKTNLTDGEDTVICPDFFTYVPSSSAVTTSTEYLLDDQDSRIKYTGDWTVSLGERNELMMQTGMFTEVPNSIFEVEFEGTGIEVYGAVYLNETAIIRAELKLDGGAITTFAPPEPTADVYNQRIFQASNLSHTNHKLTGTLVNSGLFIVDYFLIQPGDPNLDNTVPPTPETQSGKKSHVGAIAGGVIGGLTLVLLPLLVYWWWRRKKNIASQKELEAVGADNITPYPINTNTNSNSNVPSPLRMREVGGERPPPPLPGKRNRKRAQADNLDLAFIDVPVYVGTSGSESSRPYSSYSGYSLYSPNPPIAPLRFGDVPGRGPLPSLNNRPLTEYVDSGLRFREGNSLPPPSYTQD